MRMQVFTANKMREIEDFVNKNGIEQSRIVDIFISPDNEFTLVYYAE